MKVELTEHPKGNQRFEILLGGTLYIISLEEGKKLADLIYESHPTAKAENEALRERNKIMSDLLVEIYDMIELRIPKHDALPTKRDGGFFCQKCGTVYESGIMACRTCNPKTYASLVSEKLDVSDS